MSAVQQKRSIVSKVSGWALQLILMALKLQAAASSCVPGSLWSATVPHVPVLCLKALLAGAVAQLWLQALHQKQTSALQLSTSLQFVDCDGGIAKQSSCSDPPQPLVT